MKSISTDAQLVAAALAGSLSAFEALVVRHQHRLYLQALRYVHTREEAQDALQDAFLKSFSQLEALKDRARFSSWVGQMLRNICLNRLRDYRRHQDVAKGVFEETDLGEHPEQPVIRNAVLKELFSSLPGKSAEVLTLHYLEGYSIQDVALLVRTTPASVKQRLYRGRRKLQEEVARMARDDRTRHDLPEGFAAGTIARLLEQGRRDRLYMRIDEARARFREALEVAPEHPGALMELGRTYDPIEGPSEEEVATLQRAAKAAPKSIDIAFELTAVSSGDRQKQDAAVEKCMELCNLQLAKDPDDTVALTARAQMFLWKSDFEKMEEVARHAVNVAPENQQCQNYLALSLARQNRWDEAYSVYQTMYELDKRTVWAYVALRQIGCYWAFYRGEWDRAVDLQEKVWNLSSKPNEAGNLIYFYGRAGMLEKAEALFEKVKDHRHPARVYEVVGKEAV